MRTLNNFDNIVWPLKIFCNWPVRPESYQKKNHIFKWNEHDDDTFLFIRKMKRMHQTDFFFLSLLYAYSITKYMYSCSCLMYIRTYIHMYIDLFTFITNSNGYLYTLTGDWYFFTIIWISLNKLLSFLK